MDREVRHRYKNQRNIVVQVRETAVKPRLIVATGVYRDGKIQGVRWK